MMHPLYAVSVENSSPFSKGLKRMRNYPIPGTEKLFRRKLVRVQIQIVGQSAYERGVGGAGNFAAVIGWKVQLPGCVIPFAPGTEDGGADGALGLDGGGAGRKTHYWLTSW